MPAPQDTAGPEPDAASHLVPEATAGRIFGLAVPALGVLADRKSVV